MKFQIKRNTIIDNLKMASGSRVVLGSHDKEVGRVTCVAYLNNGETVSQSKSFKSLAGAEKWASQWVTAK